MYKFLIVFLLSVSSLYSKAQVTSYLGLHNTSFTYYAELDTSRFVVRLQVLVGFRDKDESLLLLKAGYKVATFTKKKNLSLLVYMPVMNYNFAQRAYNTPFNVEMDYKLPMVRFNAGVFIFLDKIDYYGTISIPFK